MPTIALTDQFIQSLKPSEDAPQTDYRDQKSPGLILRVSAKSKRWSFVYSFNRKRRRLSVGSYGKDNGSFSLKAARDKASDFRQLMKDGIDPAHARKRVIRENTTETVREMLALRLQNMREDGRSAAYIDDFRRLIEGRVLPSIGDVPIRQVGVNDLTRIFANLRREGLTGTHNKLCSALPTLWKVARVPYPGTYEIRRMKQNASPPPFSVHEVQAMLAHARDKDNGLSPMACLAIQFAALTLKRRGEVSLARLSEVDFVTEQWTIPADHSKSGRGEVIPLSPQALSVLNEALNHPARRDLDDEDRPFFVTGRDWKTPLGAHNMTRVFRQLKAAAGLPKDNRTLHVLRHSGATALAASETPPYIVSALLGHSFSGAGAAVTSRYNQYSFLSERRDALLRLGGMIARETCPERLQRPESVPVAVSEALQ